MTQDNSDTTHLDAYPAKRAWNQLPWWVRAALMLAALVTIGEFILVNPTELFTPQSPWDVIASVFTVAFFVYLPVSLFLTLRKDPLPRGLAGLVLAAASAPLIGYLTLGAMERADLSAGAERTIALALIPVMILWLVAVGFAILAFFARERDKDREAKLTNGSDSDRGLSHEDRNDPNSSDGYGQPGSKRLDDLP